VHIRRGSGNLPESGGLEAVPVPVLPAHSKESRINAVETGIMEPGIGECGSTVTVGAFGLAGKERKAALGRFRQGLLIAGYPSVKRAVSSYDGTFEGSDSSNDIFQRYPCFSEGLKEGLAVAGKAAYALNDIIFGAAKHDAGREQVLSGLLLKGVGPAIPEEACIKSDIQDAGRMAAKGETGHAAGIMQAIAPVQTGIVATGARYGAIPRKSGIKEQLFTQRNYSLGEGVGGAGDRDGKAPGCPVRDRVSPNIGGECAQGTQEPQKYSVQTRPPKQFFQVPILSLIPHISPIQKERKPYAPWQHETGVADNVVSLHLSG